MNPKKVERIAIHSLKTTKYAQPYVHEPLLKSLTRATAIFRICNLNPLHRPVKTAMIEILSGNVTTFSGSLAINSSPSELLHHFFVCYFDMSTNNP